MTTARYRITALSVGTLALLSLMLSGCKAQQQMQQQMAEMDNKLKQVEQRSRDLENELKKTNFELNQMKTLVSKVSEVTLSLQKAEEQRAAAAEEARARAAAANSKNAKKLPPPPKHGAKKPVAPAKKKH